MKEQREFNGEGTVFSINGSETPGLSHAKKKKKVKKERRRKKEGKTRNLDRDLSQKLIHNGS